MPARHCVTCGKEGDKADFLRVVRTPEGICRIDETGKAAGRGAYICRDRACIAGTVKGKRLNRSFRTAVPEEIYEALRHRCTE